LIIEDISVPARLFRGLETNGDAPPNALYALYEEVYGVTIRRAVEHLRAVIATAEETKLLNLPSGTPLIEIDRLGEALDGTPVELRLSRCNTQSHTYRSEIE
jgi:GntR family transcriptional regulator